ncbi:MAG: methyl-accepting chemotaxis protein [Treponemataceae bacterium]|nr:methyl-accepting chemotaxis protein [Treponemataceae bacterium]
MKGKNITESEVYMKLSDFTEKKRSSDSLSGKSLAKEIFSRLFIPSAIIWVTTIILVILLGNVSVSGLLSTIASGVFFCLLLYFGLIWVGSLFACAPVGENMAEIDIYESTARERTKLLKQILNLPMTMGLVTFLIFFACGAVWISIISNYGYLDPASVYLCGLTIFMGAYFCAVYLMTSPIQKACSDYACRIVEKGVSKAEIEKKHCFGTNSKVMVVINIFLPIVFIGLLFYVLAKCAAGSGMGGGIMFRHLIVIGVECAAFYLVFVRLIFNKMMLSINNMRHQLNGMNKENLHKVEFEKTDLSNEFMYNVYLINTIVEILQKILKESQKISMDVIESSNELSVISRETAVTSLEQNSGIKELLSAMKETDALSKNISEKIGEVSIVAKKTTENIVDGFDILKQNMNKLDEIRAANDITVEGIKNLTEKISGINDIARIINSIADQTNIIAFNAELEASSAGEVGENFSLVANEIRRLTNSTIQSTEEIRKRIIETQHSSDELLLASQNGTKKILDGNKIINALNLRFEELKKSSESMDYASEDIKKIIEQQTASFAQIVITLQQIAQTTESFSSSTQKISDSAQNLCTISDSLKKLQPEDEKEVE